MGVSGGGKVLRKDTYSGVNSKMIFLPCLVQKKGGGQFPTPLSNSPTPLIMRASFM